MENDELADLLKCLVQFRNPLKLQLFFLIAEKNNPSMPQLREETHRNTNDVSHCLTDLKAAYLIALNDGHYSLTKIGYNLCSVLRSIGSDPSAIKLSAAIQAVNEVLQCPKR